MGGSAEMEPKSGPGNFIQMGKKALIATLFLLALGALAFAIIGWNPEGSDEALSGHF